MNKEPIIETDRLILRPIALDDAEACFSWNSDERVAKYMSYSTYTDIRQTIDWIKSTLVDESEWNWSKIELCCKQIPFIKQNKISCVIEPQSR